MFYVRKLKYWRPQELIWRGREEEEASSRDTSTELAFSDLDNILNWNTSSSFENLTVSARPRTPGGAGRRRAGVSDKELDDMAARMKAAANRTPTTVASTVGMTDQSYLLLSPLEAGGSCADQSLGTQTNAYDRGVINYNDTKN
jgi:hypothetical protein